MSNYFTQHSQYKTHNDPSTATKTKQITSPKTTSIGSYQVIQKAGQSGTNLTSPQTITTFKNVQNTIATAATTYPAKMNSHLLDHGYGATLQPSYTLDPPKKDNDFRITNYYKASTSTELLEEFARLQKTNIFWSQWTFFRDVKIRAIELYFLLLPSTLWQF